MDADFGWLHHIPIGTVAMLAGNYDCATNPHPHLTDLEHKICMQRMQILAGFITSLLALNSICLVFIFYVYYHLGINYSTVLML